MPFQPAATSPGPFVQRICVVPDTHSPCSLLQNDCFELHQRILASALTFVWFDSPFIPGVVRPGAQLIPQESSPRSFTLSPPKLWKSLTAFHNIAWRSEFVLAAFSVHFRVFILPFVWRPYSCCTSYDQSINFIQNRIFVFGILRPNALF
jgi:hypothetical protein